MTQISPEERQRAKTAAANAAVAANDAAVVLGAAGAVVVVGGVASGVGALAGVGVGAALGVCSFGAWLVGNRYQRLANDPPRNDFDQVTTSAAFVVEEELPADAPDSVVARFAAQQLVLTDALAALVTSIERCDGADAAQDGNSASTQADAVTGNAQAAVAAQDALVSLAEQVNEAWTATIPTVDWSSVSLQQAQDQFNSDIGDGFSGTGIQTAMSTAGGLADTDLVNGDDLAAHPLLTAADMPVPPDVLISESYVSALQELSASLAGLTIADNA